MLCLIGSWSAHSSLWLEQHFLKPQGVWKLIGATMATLSLTCSGFIVTPLATCLNVSRLQSRSVLEKTQRHLRYETVLGWDRIYLVYLRAGSNSSRLALARDPWLSGEINWTSFTTWKSIFLMCLFKELTITIVEREIRRENKHQTSFTEFSVPGSMWSSTRRLARGNRNQQQVVRACSEL